MSVAKNHVTDKDFQNKHINGIYGRVYICEIIVLFENDLIRE